MGVVARRILGKNKKLHKMRRWRKICVIIVGAACAAGIAVGYWYFFSLKSPTLLWPPLKDLAAVHNVALGVHVEPDGLNNKIYAGIVSSQFDFLTLDGGGSSFSQIQPGPTIYDFANADKMVNFAVQHNMPVQFHHLVWGDAVNLPNWLLKGGYSKNQILQILHNHISTIMDRYRGRVQTYTVVNEAFAEEQHVYGVKNWFVDQLGNNTSYVDQMFIWAHQADPTATLLLNDFDDETKTSVSNAMLGYIKAARARGVPIDGIGMQMHIDASRPPSKQAVVANMKRFAAIGVPVYVTEFDINTNAVKADKAYKEQLETKIAKDMVGACIESKACVSFDVFGLTNKNDLVRILTRANSREYMFDSRYVPRQQYYAFHSAW